MPVTDYTHIVTLGSMCMPTHQLRRVAVAGRWPWARYSGPFDWFVVDLPYCVRAIATDFVEFMRPEQATCLGVVSERFWRVRCDDGLVSMHHLPWKAADTEPSVASWFTFGQWLGQRLCRWRETLASADARLLVVRASDPGSPDQPSDLVALAELLARRSACRTTVAAVSFGAPLRVDHPGVRTFGVAPSWPASVAPAAVDWGKNYGWGPAWQGRDASWDEIWETL
jgi:putative papain-like cysteine peptidase DUF1796